MVLDYLVWGAGTAADRRVGGLVKPRVLAALDRFALGRADVVALDTAEPLAELPPRVRGRAVVVPARPIATHRDHCRRRMANVHHLTLPVRELRLRRASSNGTDTWIRCAARVRTWDGLTSLARVTESRPQPSMRGRLGRCEHFRPRDGGLAASYCLVVLVSL